MDSSILKVQISNPMSAGRKGLSVFVKTQKFKNGRQTIKKATRITLMFIIYLILCHTQFVEIDFNQV